MSDRAIANERARQSDIIIGNATLCFNFKRKCWVIPGGQLLDVRVVAERYAARMNELMRGGV